MRGLHGGHVAGHGDAAASGLPGDGEERISDDQRRRERDAARHIEDNRAAVRGGVHAVAQTAATGIRERGHMIDIATAATHRTGTGTGGSGEGGEDGVSLSQREDGISN